MAKRQISHNAYNVSGCRVETVVAESPDFPAVTDSVTVYDFLDRSVI